MDLSYRILVILDNDPEDLEKAGDYLADRFDTLPYFWVVPAAIYQKVDRGWLIEVVELVNHTTSNDEIFPISPYVPPPDDEEFADDYDENRGIMFRARPVQPSTPGRAPTIQSDGFS